VTPDHLSKADGGGGPARPLYSPGGTTRRPRAYTLRHVGPGHPRPLRPESYAWGLPGLRTRPPQVGVWALSSGDFPPPSPRGYPGTLAGCYPALDDVQNLPSAGAALEHLQNLRRPPPFELAVQTAVVTRPSHLVGKKEKALSSLTPPYSHPSKSRPQPRAEMGAQKGRSKLPTFRWGARRPRNNGQIKAARAYAQ